MDLINTKVVHREFGEGTIIAQEDLYITIKFQIREIRFQYPKAFVEYLVHEDKDIAVSIKEEIEILKRAIKNVAEDKDKPKEKERDNIRKKKLKIYPRTNIAFKCNFCDGGHSNERIGFNGVCSDDIIRNNIEIEKRVWCADADCSCGQYLKGELSRTELDDMCRNSGFVCYESQMLRDWKALAGVVHSGKRKGQPMKLNQVQNNSLCVLTTRDPNSSENERYIFGVFLVDHPYEGDNQDEGYVSSKSKYRIELSPKEARKMLFWNYHSNHNQPEVAVWSSGLHRYFEDEEAMQILHDIAKLKRNTNKEELAKDFLNYFAEISSIELSNIPEKKGALQFSEKVSR